MVDPTTLPVSQRIETPRRVVADRIDTAHVQVHWDDQMIRWHQAWRDEGRISPPCSLASLRGVIVSRSQRDAPRGVIGQLLQRPPALEHMLSVTLVSQQDDAALTLCACAPDRTSLDGLPWHTAQGELVGFDPLVRFAGALRALDVPRLNPQVSSHAPAAADLRAALQARLPANCPQPVVETLIQLGFTPDTLRVLPLISMIAVAWADHQLDDAERAAIETIALQHGITTDQHAFQVIHMLLSAPPDRVFMDRSLDVLKQLYAVLSSQDRDDAKANIIDFAFTIAKASGGFLGLGDKVSEREHALITDIARRLGVSR